MALKKLWLQRFGGHFKSGPKRRYSTSLPTLTGKSPFLQVADEIQEAISTNKPVVALETTIYTHGFPYPENTALASRLESLVRTNGGIPATIGVLRGTARIGLNPEELIELTVSAGKPETKKLSRRDLGYILGLGMTGRNLNGGTTIAGTMALAHLAGIKIFATGGLGGVHRDGENSMDISADLTELGRTPVAVISSGCKSFLDISRTLEYLETQGVGVGTFADGRVGKADFPAFWTRDSGIPSPLMIEDENEAAAIIYAQHSLGLSTGMLFANPIPEKHSIAKVQMDTVMAQAIQDADASGFVGSDNTPFVLKRIRDLTDGQTITANRALVEANVVRGTKVAMELAKLQAARGGSIDRPSQISSMKRESASVAVRQKSITEASAPADGVEGYQLEADVVVAGAVAIDLSCDMIPQKGANTMNAPIAKTSNPARITQGLGGVGQNVATAIHYLGASVHLCSLVGDDVAGSTILDLMRIRGLSKSNILKRPNLRTAQYVAINNAHKDLVLGMADMSILEQGGGELDSSWELLLDSCRPKWVVVDSCWDPQTLRSWILAAKTAGAKVALEPVSIAKARRFFEAAGKPRGFPGVVPENDISIAAPNLLELDSMHATARQAGLFERDDWWQLIDSMGLSSSGSREKLISMTSTTLVDEGVPQQSIQLLPFIPSILTKLGERGVLMAQLLAPEDTRLRSPAHAQYILSSTMDLNDTIGGVYLRLFSPVEKLSEDAIVSVNGVGDTFLGIVVAGLAKNGSRPLDEMIDIAQHGSVMTLRSQDTVHPDITDLKRLL
ncbi:MAG: hypothetical protein Q9214_000085 [Letrouitia sp. 1 TL-2023]